MPDRWSTDTREIAARIIAKSHLGYAGLPSTEDSEGATNVLNWLADAGLLVQPNTGPKVGICGDRLEDVAWALCDLPAGHAGWHGAPNPSTELAPPSRMSWTVKGEPISLTTADHRTDAPPPHTGPRVWAMPEIPPDVKQVRDSDGEVWTRHDGSWAHPDDDPDGLSGTPEDGLIQAFGPLTEVLPNGD